MFKSQGNGDTGPICHRCESFIPEGKKVCECGAPTIHMSFEERNLFEVERYRAMTAKTA